MLLVLRPFREVDGGIGNYLFHLCHSILYAQASQATLVIPRPLAYATMNQNAVALDFSTLPSPAQPRPPWWDGVTPRQRAPISYDPERIEVISGLLHGNEVTRRLDFAARYHCMQEYVRSLFAADAPHDALGDQTLVIHVRSGDIFEAEPNAKYGQPPLSWYQTLIEDSGFREVTIVAQTQISVGAENPVLGEIRKRWPRLRIVSETVERDFHTLRHARHLALSVGTFAVAAAMLNTRLETLHVPRYERMRDENFSDIFPPGTDLGFSRYDYAIDGYQGMRNWANTRQQIDLMLHHSPQDIRIERESTAARGDWHPPQVGRKQPR